MKVAYSALETALDKRVEPVYLLSGDQDLLRELAAAKIQRAVVGDDPSPFVCERFDGESGDSSRIVMAANQMPLLGGRRFLLVKRASRLVDGDETLQSYDAVIASELSTPETNLLKEFAKAGKGACLAETGKPDEGIPLIKKVIQDNDPNKEKRLFAYANNALGNCYLKKSQSKDALLSFLQTHLLFFGDADTHAEALYQLSKLGDSLNRPEIASDARETLRQRFAGSHWLAKQ